MYGQRTLLAVLFLLVAIFILGPVNEVLAAQGTMTGDNVNVRAEPTTNSQSLGKLNKGDKVTIHSEQNEWYEIDFGSQRAYVHRDFVSKASVQQKPPSPSTSITIIVNGKTLVLDVEPVMEDNRLLLPFRVIGESLGIDVQWRPQEGQVYGNDRGDELLFTIGKEDTLVNGKVVQVSPPPKIISGRTVIPLRFFAESFGANVYWDQQTKTVTIQRQIVEDKSVEEPIQTEQPKQSEPQPEPTIHLSEEYQYIGIVESTTLNVRTGPGTTHEKVTTLNKGDSVTLKSLVGNWVKISRNGMTGYVHTYYLSIYRDNENITMLVNPKLTSATSRESLSWKKVGKVTATHSLSGQRLQIKTSANEVIELANTHPAIELIEYEQDSSGTTIDVYIKKDYQVVIQDTTEDLTIVLLKPGTDGKLIVIDPGHGGKDPGAVVDDLNEKDIVLDVSLRVQKLLNEAKVNVIMTRTTDIYLTLDDRVRLAEAAKADAFISIHANAADNRNANGIETFWDATNSAYTSEELAETIQAQLLAMLGTTDRGTKERGFYVIKHSKMPSALVELGFLTNEAEYEKLGTDEFRKKAAQAIFQGILEFYGEPLN